MARFLDRLLGRPLARDLVLHSGSMDSVTVPAGSRLRKFGNVGLRHGYIDMPEDGQPLPIWKFHGNWKKFLPADGDWIDLPWTEVDRYLAGFMPARG